MKIFDYEITTESFPFDYSSSNKTLIINTINAYSFQVAKKDSEFKNALQNSDFLIPDGYGFKIAARILNNERINKYSGYELHKDILGFLNKTRGACFYFGSSKRTLELIKEHLILEYSNIKVDFYSPPFESEFTENENEVFLEKINSFHPDVLFIGLTAPKQEKWAIKNRNKIEAKYICSIGAVFDFYAGTVRKPNPLLVKIGLEWVSRFYNDPKHMIKRYKNFPVTSFLFDIFKFKIKI
ncbi:MAG: WecB/TagA/CpsF family glycosyltransferase [Bacteroidales bacterium]|nr:WecB/TagA/CpsF family glycosyltransferase [Bacteroidales bacterium]